MHLCSAAILLAFLPAEPASLVPPADGKPILQLDAGGPMAAVTALAFAPDGNTLYVGGYDKVVRVWTRDDKGSFAQRKSLHVPIGPGLNGLINAVAVSPDGRWLAAAGSGAVRGAAGFADGGVIVPLAGRLTPEMRQDWGAIYLFDLEKDRDQVRPLRGHRGPVLSLTFLPAHKDKPPLLVSTGREGDDKVAVRLWDAARGRLLAERDDLPDPGGNEPPGLAAWHTGPTDQDVTAAVALARDWTPGRDNPPPGSLNIWEAKADRLLSRKLDPWFFTNTAAFRPGGGPDQGVLFTGGARSAEGGRPRGAYLRAWSFAADGPEPDGARTEFVGEGAVPRTLALVPGTAGAATDLAAAVLAFPPDKSAPAAPTFRLLLLGRTVAGGFGDVKTSVPLWAGAGRPPVTAASPDGRLLALAGGPDHSVWLFAVADLLKDKPGPFQKIAAAGVRASEVAFVHNGKAPGLLVRQRRPDEGWVLDFDGHALQEGAKGWEADAPDPGGWKCDAAADGLSFTVANGDREVGVVHLAAGRPKAVRPEPTCPPALLPPCKPLDRPLLAVGYLEQGVSYLEVFDVIADRRVRRLTGHVDAVRALAFGGDGRLLASAADDQTVAVWSLTDLGATAGKAGSLPGFVVEQKGEGVVVAALDDGALSAVNKKALQGVQVGDAVAGVVRGKALKAVAAPQELYDAVWAAKPGDPIRLRVGGADVTLTAEQGEDERKPLFSLFLRDGPGDRLWLAWSPVGPYDASDRPGAEAVIGWHTNTGKASAPVAFDPAAQYRKESYRPGLLKYLVAEGNLSDALKAWDADKPPPPGMGLRLEAPKALFPRAADGRVLVQGPPPGLTLRAELFGILPAKVRQARWRFDAGEWRPFDRQSDLAFTAELDAAKLDWQGRPHEFSLLAETVEDPPAEYVKRLSVVFAPPPPKVTSAQPDAATVNAAAFTFEAAVAPAEGKARVLVRLNNDGPRDVGLDISEKYTLQEGDNVIEVVAVNDGAAAAFADAETTTRRWRVRYDPPKKVTSPTIYLESASSASEPPQKGKALVVHARTVRVRGRITSPEPLVEATCDGRALAGFAAADKRDAPIDESVALKEVDTEQTVTFSARHDKGDPATETLLLKYEPPAPRFEFDADAPGSVVAADAANVELKGGVRRAEDDPSKITAEVRLNGKPVEGVRLTRDRLSAPLALAPGDNVIEVVLANPFDRHADAAHCYRRRPPIVKGVGHSEAGENPLTELTAVVESPADRPLSGVRVANDAAPGPSPEATLTKQGPPTDGAQLQTWKVVVPAVLLKEGQVNRLRLWARSEDGETLAPGETAITVAPKKPAAPPPPDVTVLEPRLAESVVEAPRGRLSIRVQWHGPAGVAAVLLNGVERADAGLAASPPAEDGAVIYRTEALPLAAGPNVVQVRAVNAGGKRLSESYTLFYKPRVAFIRLTGWSAGERDAPTTLTDAGPGGPQIPGQKSARIWVHGEVEWPDESDPALAQDGPARLRVWVNDFEQFEARLRPRQGLTRAFTAELRLNNSANRVEIGSSDVKVEKVAFGVACARPAREQRLHLLVVAPGRRDESQVTQEVLAAFQARHIHGDHFDSPAFVRGRVYGPVIKLARREEVFDAVEDMKGAIGGGADHLNDVIVVYFQGEQLATENEHYLLTGETLLLLPGLAPGRKLDAEGVDKLKETALTCDKFRELLADVRGAKLVLLDARDPVGGADVKRRVDDLLGKAGERFPKVACLDYVLLGGAGDEGLAALLQKSLARTASLKELAGEENSLSLGTGRLFRCYVPDGLLGVQLGGPEQ